MSMPSELADGINDKSIRQVVADNAKAAANPYRWIVLTIAFAAFFITFLGRLAWASANLFVSQTLNIPIAASGVFVTALYAGYVTASALAGF